MEYAEVLVKIHVSSECDLLIMLKNYRQERKSAILNFTFFFARNFIITAFVLIAALIAMTAPLAIFMEWLGPEFGFLLGFPFMAFLTWVICTHKKLEAFLKEYWDESRSWRYEWQFCASAIQAINGRLSRLTEEHE